MSKRRKPEVQSQKRRCDNGNGSQNDVAHWL